METKLCEVCGKPFEVITLRSQKKYCSSNCNLKAYRDRHPETLKERRKEAYHKKNGREYHQKWREENREKVLEANRKYQIANPERGRLFRQPIRLAAFNHISNNNSVCKICGFSDMRALQIDHVNGKGGEDMRKLGLKDYQVKYWNYILSLPKEEVIKKFQILCANHNLIKVFENKELIKNKKERSGCLVLVLKHLNDTDDGCSA